MTFPVGSLESSVTTLSFALILRDRLSFADALAGQMTVTAGSATGLRRGSSGEFVFFGLAKGPISLSVRSSANTPYYLPTTIAVTLPMTSPLWPAYPDSAIADLTLDLWDPNQPAAYRSQFLAACLSPSIAYPFDSGATLVRGVVTDSGTKAALANATVSSSAATLPYVTGADGQFVLVFQQPPALPTPPVTILAQCAGQTDVSSQVALQRAATVTLQISM
jgi:hypothetical protein